MWLIDAETYELKYFGSDDPPRYAILSHTWDSDEVNFQEFQKLTRSVKRKKGFLKIRGACEQALRDGHRYVWIDTCCIDKSSSAELSEAINSMFEWYADAWVCYVYLSDVFVDPESVILDEDGHAVWTETEFEEKVKGSRWFTRGWTLQELLAPSNVEFYASDWCELGSKRANLRSLAEITGIPVLALRLPSRLRAYSVAARLSWASKRSTTRIEDETYCLLGIMRINMPLLYGEGSHAFQRLQEEILRTTSDESILTWTRDHSEQRSTSSLFATRVSDFANCHTMLLSRVDRFSKLTLTNVGLEIEGECFGFSKGPKQNEDTAVLLQLNCIDSSTGYPVQILMRKTSLGRTDSANDLYQSKYYREHVVHKNIVHTTHNLGLRRITLLRSVELLSSIHCIFSYIKPTVRTEGYSASPVDDEREESYLQIKSLDTTYGTGWSFDSDSGTSRRISIYHPPLFCETVLLCFEVSVVYVKRGSTMAETAILALQIDQATGFGELQFDNHKDAGPCEVPYDPSFCRPQKMTRDVYDALHDPNLRLKMSRRLSKNISASTRFSRCFLQSDLHHGLTSDTMEIRFKVYTYTDQWRASEWPIRFPGWQDPAYKR